MPLIHLNAASEVDDIYYLILFCFVTERCTIPKLDVVFVLDVSISIETDENFELMKSFIKDTAHLINININATLAALVLFGGNAWIRFPLTEHTNESNFQKAVDDIKYDEVKQIGTNTPSVLNLLRIAGQDGRLKLRNDTIKIAVFITDGRPHLNHLNITRKQANADTKDAAKRLHDSGVYDQIYSIGIEGRKPIGKILNSIAYPSSLVFLLERFDATLFETLTRKLILSFCNCKLKNISTQVIVYWESSTEEKFCESPPLA